ncbi:energy transducer TonB [Daejeonella oryzae]|uniref:energy transducer TonB n=1 Tax=Daejeonella oryzae TaxID=1122943 RepID=UPI0003F9C158|nr:energy transducer TonB [Daejeonella oryzae]
MINFTENLYKAKWLELVFQNRNKTYGAYQLRQHNAETTVKALVFASILFTTIIISPMLYNQLSKSKIIENTETTPEPTEVIFSSQINQSRPPSAPKSPNEVVKIKTVQNPPMKVVSESQMTTEPPSQIDLASGIIGQTTSDGIEGLNEPLNTSAGSGNTSALTDGPEDLTIYNYTSIESYPEFPGGLAAFSKYLSRNLKFPSMAIENNVQGRVIVSFIIEKNGDLSNIKILKGIGSGCDEEAIRVLAKSPKWKAGIQNKQNVRVAYTIPINFQLPN